MFLKQSVAKYQFLCFSFSKPPQTSAFVKRHGRKRWVHRLHTPLSRQCQIPVTVCKCSQFSTYLVTDSKSLQTSTSPWTHLCPEPPFPRGKGICVYNSPSFIFLVFLQVHLCIVFQSIHMCTLKSQSAGIGIRLSKPKLYVSMIHLWVTYFIYIKHSIYNYILFYNLLYIMSFF